MPASYPTALNALPDKVDSLVTLADFNEPRREIAAIEAELGINPSGAASTVAERLSTLAKQAALAVQVLDTRVADLNAPAGAWTLWYTFPEYNYQECFELYLEASFNPSTTAGLVFVLTSDGNAPPAPSASPWSEPPNSWMAQYRTANNSVTATRYHLALTGTKTVKLYFGFAAGHAAGFNTVAGDLRAGNNANGFPTPRLIYRQV